MRKRFVTNLFFLLALNIIIKSFWILGVDRGVQNALPASEYGLYFALLNFSFIFNILLDFGLTNYNNRLIAQHPQLLSKYISQLVPIKFAMSIIFTIVVFTVAISLGYDTYALKLLGLLCLSQFFSSLLIYLRSNISGLLLFKTDSILSVLDRFIVIVLCSILLWSGILQTEFKIEYFIYTQLFAYFITALVALIICFKKAGFIKLRWNYPFIVKIIKDSYPYATLILLMAFYNKADGVMVERILDDGAAQAGIYASAFRLVDAVNMIAYLFSIILLPLFSRLIKNKDDVRPIIKVSFHLLLMLTVSFVALSQIYGYDLMHLMYNKHIDESSQVFRILSICFIPISMTYIFGTLLTANGSLKHLNIVAGLGMILNISINLFLIPKFLALGAAYSSLIAQTITAIFQALIAIKIFKIKFVPLYALKIIFFVISLISTAIIFQNITTNWAYNIIITSIAMVILSFIFRIFQIKDILSLLKASKE
ncbi:MAG: polysaccharide biosynthesis C-terminal domain-containing protein [Bacteroidales bacterium]|nr:polysaccharide biosynthesis C-terminal domain-containing protein [Bacteroidales bacterium]